MAKLYDLNNDFQQVQQMIEDGNEGLQDTLESIELSMEDKLENIGKVIQNLKGESEALKQETKRLSDKKKSIDNSITRLKEYAENSLTVTGKDKIKSGLFTFAMQNNPPQVRILDDSMIPSKYFIEQEPKLNKNSLKETLKESELPGAELYQGRSLRIK